MERVLLVKALGAPAPLGPSQPNGYQPLPFLAPARGVLAALPPGVGSPGGAPFPLVRPLALAGSVAAHLSSAVLRLTFYTGFALACGFQTKKEVVNT